MRQLRGALRGGSPRSRAAIVALVLVAGLIATASISGLGTDASAAPSASDWQRLRQCESGDSYTISTGNGYYGAYQFDLGTWQSVGGTGYPHQASPATQDALALKLWEQRGWSPWACATIIGLTSMDPPAGSIDVFSVSNQTATITGWSYDPIESGTSTQVHVYVNNKFNGTIANVSRNDVNSAFGISGQHGFTINVRLDGGPNTVCIFAIGVDPNTHSDLGCRVVTGPYPPVATLDSIRASGYKVTVAGWTFDPTEPSASTWVAFSVNGRYYSGQANKSRPDVSVAYGISGQHGFSESLPLRSGTNVVCTYAINLNPNVNYPLGCYGVAGPPAGSPLGYVDSATLAGSTLTVAGWGFDPTDAENSTQVHVYVDWNLTVAIANQARNDVNAAFGITGQHGFTATVPALGVGDHLVCSYAIGVDPNVHTGLSCSTISVVANSARFAAAAPETASSASSAAAAQSDRQESPASSPTVTAATSSDVISPVAPVTSQASLSAQPSSGVVTTASSSANSTATVPTSTSVPTLAWTPDSPPALGQSGLVPASGTASGPTPTGARLSTVLTTPTAAPSSKGALDSLIITGMTGTLTGWIADQSAGSTGTWVRITVNGVTHDVLATGTRTDVKQPDRTAVLRGFSDALNLAKGPNELCLYEIDENGGISTAPITCRTDSVK